MKVMIATAILAATALSIGATAQNNDPRSSGQKPACKEGEVIDFSTGGGDEGSKSGSLPDIRICRNGKFVKVHP